MSGSPFGISKAGHLGVAWMFVAINTILLSGRLLVRSTILRSFHMDDFFVVLAWLLMIASDVLLTIYLGDEYYFANVGAGNIPMPPQNVFLDLLVRIQKGFAIPSQTFFWVILFSVKFSFLFLYRLVFNASKLSIRLWYAASTFTICSLGICLIGVYGQCGPASNLFNYEKCLSPTAPKLFSKLLWVDYAFNMATDFIIIGLPLPVIWRLNMLRSQKLSLTMITSLAIVTIAFDTVRTVKLFQLDSRLTDLYSTLELHIAVLISILPTYRFLVSNTDRNREYQRLFWSRITFGSVGSGRSYSMHSMPNHSGQSSEGLAPGAAGPQSGIEQTRTISVVREPVAKKVNT